MPGSAAFSRGSGGLGVAQAAQQFRWVRPPRQSRSQESLERLLDAAEECFAAKGFEQTTIAEIVRRANSSVGGFYLRFKDKEALLLCLYDRFCEEAFATTDAVLDANRWAGSPIREILAETIPFLVEVYRQRGPLIRTFILRSSTNDAFAERWMPTHCHLFDRVRELLLSRQDEIGHPVPDVAMEMGLQLVLSALDSLIMLPVFKTRGLALDDPRLPVELTRAFLSYLGSGPGGEYADA